MTGELSPPFLDLAFYLGRPADNRALVYAWEILAARGASLEGTDDLQRAGRIERLGDTSLQRDGNERRLYIRAGTGLTEVPEILEQTAGLLTLRTEGEVFCGTARSARRRLLRAGDAVSELFIAIAEALDPLYGSICVEYSLETPDELRADARSLAFKDFYLSTRRLGNQVVQRALKEIGSAAFVKRLKHGVYVSTSAEFNPERCELKAEDAQWRSAAVSRVLAGSTTLK